MPLSRDVFLTFEGPLLYNTYFFDENLPEVIFEKFKGPCGHDNPSFGAFAPHHFAGYHF